LLGAAERVARDWGCDLLEVSSGRRPERADAHRFHLGAGFADTDEQSVRQATHGRLATLPRDRPTGDDAPDSARSQETAMIEFDPGPPPALAEHLAALPSYGPEERALFWYDWGPIFYRGRLDGSAKLLAIASDPGPTERIACRTLVGDAGQRVQGFLAKLGLTRSYVLVNAHPYALHPGRASKGLPLLATQPHRDWRNRFYDEVVGSTLEAIVAFGQQAARALALWTPPAGVRTFELPHPSSHDATELLTRWRQAIPQLRSVVTPDPDGDATLANYGSTFAAADYAPIPKRDLPYGLPDWFGDDAWGRTATPRHNNSVERPSSDPEHSLLWQAPTAK
jgi:uracil-DNA glycosylase